MPDSLPPAPGPRDRHDETRAADASLHAHWQPLLAAWQGVDGEQWRRWQDSAQQRIRQNGVTYHVYTDPQGSARPWALDIVPLALAAGEWAQIEQAIAQRARLLDRVLADLYGPQQLLVDKALPAGLIYGHNGFLWPCCGIQPPGGRFLYLYAADIARAPDGRWWVLSDRTQGPSGAGYALENRHIVGDLFPDLLRQQNVRALDDWYRLLSQDLLARAPVDIGETPFAVLLTPGPHNETWFEHVYLARQLGLGLAEGSDLTVRGDTLYLKTLSGLQRVHVVLRRQDDSYCDPLDLRADSTLGVAGLVEVARAGRVLIANALGSGVLESPGLPGFLPALCERLLGEKLQMPSVATWWCGEAAARAWVEEHLEQLVIKPAYPSQRMDPVFGDRLDAQQRKELVARIRARPNAFVAQELVHLSQAPALVSDLTTGGVPALQPRAVVLRVYAAAAEDGYRVLPGGMARVAGDTSLEVVSMQRGGSSKDVWVTGFSGVTPLHVPARAPALQHALPSRAAENLFWLGRYVERAGAHARLVQAVLLRLGTADVAAAERARVLRSLGFYIALWPDPATAPAAALDERLPGSLPATIANAGRAGTAVRASLPAGYWQSLEQAQDLVRRARDLRPRQELAHILLTRLFSLLSVLEDGEGAMQAAIAALPGAGKIESLDFIEREPADDNGDDGWHFLALGQSMERVQWLTTVAAFLLRSPAGEAAAALLPELAGLVAARPGEEKLRAPPGGGSGSGWSPALQRVLADATAVRSLTAAGAQMQDALAWLSREFGAIDDAGLATELAALRARDFPALKAEDLPAIETELTTLHAAAVALSDRISDRFFTHVDERTRRWLAV